MGGCPCENKNPENCAFLKQYRQSLDNVNFEVIYKGIKQFAETYKKTNNIQEEIIMTLIVYEAPNNLCSERGVLVDYFKSKGITVKEFLPKGE